MLQLTCRDRNRIALQSDLISAAACGVRNLLMLRGDDPSGRRPARRQSRCSISMRAGCWRPRGACAIAGELPSGRKVTGLCDFFLGAADNPIDPPPGWKPEALAAKVAAGAQFAQTQFCMDAGVVRRYMARLAEHGLADKLAVIVGIVPLRSARSARWIREKLFGAIIPDALVERMEAASDPAAEGRRICLDVVAELSEVPHVAGVHIMAPNHEAAVPEVITAARESIARLAAV